MEEKIYQLLLTMQQDVSSINTRLDKIETDITNIKTDITDIKTDIKDIKVDIKELKNITNETNTAAIKLEDNMGLLMAGNEEIRHEISKLNIQLYRNSNEITRLKMRMAQAGI